MAIILKLAVKGIERSAVAVKEEKPCRMTRNFRFHCQRQVSLQLRPLPA